MNGALTALSQYSVLFIGLSRNYHYFLLFKLERMFYNILCYYISKGDSPMTDTLLNNMERINTVAEILLDLLADNPRAQVLAEIIIEASQTKQQ